MVAGMVHAERMRLGGHQPGEFRLVAAQRLGHDHRHVIGRFGDDGADRGFHLDALTRLQAELGRRLRGGVRGDRHFRRHLDLAGLQPLEQQIERHDLGQRGRMTRAVGIGRLHHGARIGVHHDRGIGGLVAFDGGGVMVAVVASAAGVGIAGEGGHREQPGYAEGAPTKTALDQGSRTQHPLSPTPFVGRPLGRHPVQIIAPPRCHKLQT